MKFCQVNGDIASRKDLTGNDKVILGIIIYRIQMGGKDICWPGKRSLAKDAGVSADTAMECIKRLETKGLILVDRGRNGQRQYYSLTEESGRKTPPVDRSENPSGSEPEKRSGFTPPPVGKPVRKRSENPTRIRKNVTL